MVPHAPGSKTLASHLPPRLKYLRACFREFQQLPLRQDISTTPPSVAAETLFTNPRFTITLRDHSAFLWKEHVQVSTIVDLIDRDSGVTFTDDEWEAYFYELAPDPDAGHAHNFARNRAAELPSILGSIPAEILGTHSSDIYIYGREDPRYGQKAVSRNSQKRRLGSGLTRLAKTARMQLWSNYSVNPLVTLQ